MLKIDRKIARSILQLTRHYDDSVFFSLEKTCFILVHDGASPEISVPFPVPAEEIPGSLERLSAANLIKVTMRTWGGDMYFSITPELLHYKDFWWDRFSKRFLAGFVSGIVVGITANLLTGYVQSAASFLIQWLKSLL